MQNFSTIQEAKQAALNFFNEWFGYTSGVNFTNKKGIYEFYSIDDPAMVDTFQCTIFKSEPLKRPVGRPKGPEKVYIGFKIEPKYHAEVKAMVKEYIRKKTTLLK
jgi:hypothetical protein